MTCQQELELLAEWLGIEVSFYPDGVCRDVTGFHPAQNIFAAKEWNPLTNDTDFLNMVAGRVDFTFGQYGVKAEVFPEGLYFKKAHSFIDHNNDPVAAMKHAAYQVCLMAAREWKENS